MDEKDNVFAFLLLGMTVIICTAILSVQIQAVSEQIRAVSTHF